MTQMIVNLSEYGSRILDIVKGKFGVKNKAEAVSLVICKFDKENNLVYFDNFEHPGNIYKK